MDPPFAKATPHVPMPEGLEQQRQQPQDLDRKNGNLHLQLPPPLPMATPDAAYSTYAAGATPLPLETMMWQHDQAVATAPKVYPDGMTAIFASAQHQCCLYVPIASSSINSVAAVAAAADGGSSGGEDSGIVADLMVLRQHQVASSAAAANDGTLPLSLPQPVVACFCQRDFPWCVRHVYK